MSNKTHFGKFLHDIEQTNFNFHTTVNGDVTIQQSDRNKIRSKGIEAFLTDLINWYGDDFDIVRTKEGIVVVAENEPNDFTFGWEIKCTIKSPDYDPFIQASLYEDEVKKKEEKRQQQQKEKEEKQLQIEQKRAAKLAQIEKGAN